MPLILEEKNIILGKTHLEKSPVEINGFDDTTDVRLQKGRTILVCGSTDSEKILIAMGS